MSARGLPRRQSGQIIILFVVGLMSLILLLSLIFNTGQQIDARIKAQNAADAAALSQSTAVARSLNVMSMNNVAITQAFTLNVLMTALLPELVEASAKAGAKAVQYAINIASYCSACAVPPFVSCIPCAANIGLEVDLLLFVIIPLIDIWKDLGVTLDLEKGFSQPIFPPPKIRTAADITLSLVDMNKTLVREFPQTSADMAQALIARNNLGESPLFIAGDAFPQPRNGVYTGTLLPVDRTQPIKGLTDLTRLPDSQHYGLCLTGTYGTPVQFPPAYWNMQQHGYPIRTGPYLIGRDAFANTINPPVNHLEGFPHYTNVATDFEDIVKLAWPLACVGQTLFRGTLNLNAFTRIDLYRIKKPHLLVNAIGASRDDWSIVAIARQQQGSGALGGSRFPNPVDGHYAYAQAEVFNLVWYDLYTQDWQARLVPASQISDAARRRAIAGKIRGYHGELSDVLSQMPSTGSDIYNAH